MWEVAAAGSRDAESAHSMLAFEGYSTAEHSMRTTSLVSIIALVAFAQSALAGSLSADVARQAQHNWPEFLDLLAIANVAEQPVDIQRNATFLEQAFAKRGFKVRRLDNPAGRPAVLAELAGAGPQARTVLLYAHFDGQPVIPENWSQPDPFRPVVKRRDAQGKWQEVGRQALQATPLDPELRVFARSASDDKAPIMMILTAVDLLHAQQKSPAINIKVLLDPEEEMSSPSLAGMIERDRAPFAADAMVILDGPQHDSGRSTIVFGNRGITQATLTVFGPRAPLHSGHYGNYAPNPAMRLARLLASMKDDNGRVLVKGYYDGVSLSSAERASLAAVGDDEAALAQTDRRRARRESRQQLPGGVAVSVLERARHGRSRRRRESRQHRAERGSRRDRHSHDAQRPTAASCSI